MVDIRELVLRGEGGQDSIDLDKILQFDSHLCITRVGDFV